MRHASRVPKKIRNSSREFLHHFLYLTDKLLKVNIVTSTLLFTISFGLDGSAGEGANHDAKDNINV